METILDTLFDKKIISREQKILIEKYDQRLNSNKVAIIYNLRHLRKILKINKKEQNLYFGQEKNKSYKMFFIPKKNGGFRKIEAPVQNLLNCQRWIKKNILESFQVSKYAKGFKKGSSIIENAKPHVNQEVVINLDLENFFGSITYNQVFRFFIYVGYTKEVAHLLTKLCTNKLDVLPQGAPTSPTLSNILCLKLDKRLSCLAKSFEANYTRYADDITFSGQKKILKMIPLIKRIIKEENFTINYKKFRIRFSNQKQEVTGLTVNKKLSVSKRLINELEKAIYFGQKLGVDTHMENIKCDRFFYKEHLFGIAYFIKMIDKNKGNKYIAKLEKINWIY